MPRTIFCQHSCGFSPIADISRPQHPGIRLKTLKREAARTWLNLSNLPAVCTRRLYKVSALDFVGE